MEFQEINVSGQIFIEEVDNLPAWDSSYSRRLVYDKSSGSLYYGSTSQWVKVVDNTTTITTHASDTSNPHSVTTSQIGAATSSHASDTSNPHSVTTSQIGAATSSDLTTHTSDTDDPHSMLGVYSRYHNGTTANISSSNLDTWYNVEFDNLNTDYNSPISFDAGTEQFTLPTGYVYWITYEGMARKSSKSGSTPNYIMALRVVSGDTSQTLNYGSGEGGSNNESVIIGSRSDTEFEHGDTLTNWHRSVSFSMKPNQNTVVKLGAVLNSSGTSISLDRPSISILSFNV